MTDAPTHAQTIVCLASFFKGVDFLRECKRQGARVVLLTKEKWQHEEWPHESLDDFLVLPQDATPDHFSHTVTQIARQQKIARVVALEEFDVITAALIREHLRLPGIVASTARRFRDKLAMRDTAQAAGLRVPEFVGAINYGEIHDYMQRVPAPWVLKPRTDVSAIGIRKLHDAEQVWRALDELDARERSYERAPYHLLERFVPGDVFHVDSLVINSEVVFAGVNAYGRPPMNVAHEGGVFLSYTVAYDAPERAELLRLNQQVIRALGLRRGATHAEFIRSANDGAFYFLEIAARVGGAYIAETHEAATGINVWRDWAKIELADDAHPYSVGPTTRDYAGIALLLARQEWPDTSSFDEPEIAYRIRKRHHVGLVVRAP
ncbi:MAG TPA: ATP-grasp domain-containing protein, partial [Pyrinomonadaceae bacterium]|nr:ATP-grasp domain-containing protein [Pyrinomonadaceae bacterium]